MQQAFITRKMVQNCIDHAPDSGLVYLNNPKVACSSIKKSMWLKRSPDTYAGDPHDRTKSPLCKNLAQLAAQGEALANAKFFTVVRNPYVRFLSAYLNKVVNPRRDLRVWTPIARRFRLGSRIPSFSEFTKLMATEKPELMDPHFAPQSVVTLADVVTPDFIGQMEQMAETAAFLAQFGIELETHAPHVTKAADRIREFYTDAEAEAVRSIYARDFDIYGYSTDIVSLEPERPVSPPSVPREVLVDLLACLSSPVRTKRDEALSRMREAAPHLDHRYIALESDLLKLHEIIDLAHASKESKNWRLLTRLGEELTRHEVVREAKGAVDQAHRILYGPA